VYQWVGLAIENALRGIEQANQEFLYGVFGDAQWSNKNKLSDKLLIVCAALMGKLCLPYVPDREFF
jgi:hypothetical protein